MKLFLASSGLDYIKQFVEKDPSEMNMLFVPTAGNLDDDVWWIDKDRDVLSKMGLLITELDIVQASKETMQAELSKTDIIYIAGGNTFYLLHQMRLTGFDVMLETFVSGGGLYVGASAGALIIGPDIGLIDLLDEPEKVPELQSTKGFGWVDVVPIPHCNMVERTAIIEKIKERNNDTLKIVTLTDDEGLLVEDGIWQVVDSPRSKIERKWFRQAGVE
jgi:dipeptidase E